MKKRRSNIKQLLEAVSFAARGHAGQFRRDKVTPYISHPFRVALALRLLFGISDERVLAAAVLHDTIEDTAADYDDLKRLFGRDIAGWVRDLSKDRRLEEALREERYWKQLAQSPEPVRWIKLADLYDNLTDAQDFGNLKKIRRTRKRALFYLTALEKGAAPALRRGIERLRRMARNRSGAVG